MKTITKSRLEAYRARTMRCAANGDKKGIEQLISMYKKIYYTSGIPEELQMIEDRENVQYMEGFL